MGAKAIYTDSSLFIYILAQLTPGIDHISDIETIKKRARRKYIQMTFLFHLINLDSDLLSKYWSTFWCARRAEFGLDSTGEIKMVSKYCGQRWCLVCSAIRTARSITGYRKALEQINNPQFMTLTTENVKGKELKNAINNCITTTRYISKRLTKQGIKSPGIRKLECTYNPQTHRFHPHMHFICNDRYSNIFLNLWLESNRDTAHFLGQDIRPVDPADFVDIFKYYTDVFTQKKKKDGTINKQPVPPRALDTIYTAMERKRTLQPFGNLRKAKRVPQLSDSFLFSSRSALWDQDLSDWITAQGELVSGYTPTKKLTDLISKIPKT